VIVLVEQSRFDETEQLLGAGGMPGAVGPSGLLHAVVGIEGVVGLSSTLGTGLRRALRNAEFQAIQTQRTIERFWPPVPGDD
jgi:hypothetical protein